MRFVSGCARFNFRRSARVALALLLCLPALLWAQTTGSITGTVHDSTGAVIANAQVTVSNTEKGISHTTPSNSAGEYLVAGLGQGSYDITVTAEGFKKFEAKGVVLDVAQKARVDVAMQVGATGTEIVVEGTAVAQVETQASDLTGTVTGKEIGNLQLNGRNFAQLITLVPGVSNQSGQDEAQVGVSGNVAFSVNGGRTEYNNWELDGGDNMDNGSNTTLNVYPSLDAIAEVKVLTSSFGAQYGRSGSGTVEVETKGGTNKFHGDVYEFVRNDRFNARNYFDDPTVPIPGYKKNDFGYTIGGPVFIPGLYNKNKDKTFFFWSQEWRRDRVALASSTIQVPTADERTGNFSADCPSLDCPIDPATGMRFPGDQVPVDQNNAVPLLAMIPLPTQAGTRNWHASPSLPTNWREELIRVDHNLNSKMRLSARYIHDSWEQTTPSPLWTNGTSFPTIQTDFKGPGLSLVARLTATASPTLLNEFVFSYTTDHLTMNPVGAWHRPNPDTLNFPGLYQNGFGGGKLPGITLSGGTGLFNFGEDVGYLPGPYNSNPTYTYRDNVTKIVGRHNLQFGAYFVAAQKNELAQPGTAPNGAFTFDASNPISTGNALADLLVGRVSSFSQQSAQLKFYNRYKILEPYLQDDWHVTSRLTLNLGLRVSLFGTYREKYHNEYTFDSQAFIPANSGLNPDGTVSGNPFNGIVQCGGPGGAVSAFTGAFTTGSKYPGCQKGHLFNPAPRLGFAWDPKGDGKTAIRGGYGIFFEHTNGNEANVESLEPATNPNSTTTSIPVAVSSYAQVAPPAVAGSTTPFSGLSIPTKAVWPYQQQWHLDIQREVAKNTIATVSYVGSKGTHLTRYLDLNQVPSVNPTDNPYLIDREIIGPNDCSTLTTPNGHPITGQAAVNLGIAACGADANFARPFLGVGSINRLEETASSIYHGFETSVRRSVGSLQVSASYTFSHSIDDSSSARDPRLIDTYNRGAARASSNFDQRHLFNLSYVYDLPFFKSPGFKNKLLGGWEWSGITSIQSGSPFSVANGGTSSVTSDNAGVGNAIATASASSYPDLIGNPNSSIPNIPVPGFGPLLFNPSAFAAPVGLTFGTTPRNFLRNPKRTNFDMALFKHIAFKEHMAFEFRAEAFNLFNHRQWFYLGGDTGSAAANAGNGSNATLGCYAGSTNSSGDSSCIGTPGSPNTNNTYLRPNGAHNPRILQFGAKFIF